MVSSVNLIIWWWNDEINVCGLDCAEAASDAVLQIKDLEISSNQLHGRYILKHAALGLEQLLSEPIQVLDLADLL